MLNQLLDEILKEHAEEYREFLWNQVRAACNVRDYQYRIHNILYTDRTTPYIKIEPFFDRLRNSDTFNEIDTEKLASIRGRFVRYCVIH